MPTNSWIERLSQHERINFLLTNRIPRRWATLFMGRFSRIENPWVRDVSMWVWQHCADALHLEEAKKRSFKSVHDCFIRELKDGARPIERDPRILVSPCDAIVGALGPIAGTEVFQAKGFPYTLLDLTGDQGLVERYRDGIFVTLRLKSSMYHRFHAPCFHAPADCRVAEVIYISGDTWNVNPIALKRVERLFCKNERAVLDLDLVGSDEAVALVPVAAILVASIELHCLDAALDLKYKGPNRVPCNASFKKGVEIGFFQHGSTIIVLATSGFEICDQVVSGTTIKMGQALLRGV